MEYKPTKSSNICKEGKNSYRVRLMRNGIKISKSFNRYRDALSFRNNLKSSN